MRPSENDLSFEDAAIELALIERELAEREGATARAHFYDFVVMAWPIVEPREELQTGWYLRALCDHLEALTFGEHPTRHLLINIPPRFAKSLVCAVLWPAWEWLHDPTLRYLTISHSMDLAIRDAGKCRRLMESERYRAWMLPELRWCFAEDQNAKSFFENDRGGGRICSSVGSKITGKGGDRILGDDLHATNDGPGDVASAVDFWDTSAENRANNKRTVVRLIVGQRVSPEDISGHLRAKQPELWDWLVFPFVHEVALHDDGSVKRPAPTMLGFVDPRTVEGESLLPERYGPTEVAHERSKGSHYFETQWQQKPDVRGGMIFRRPDFVPWVTLPGRFDASAIHCDLSFKGTPREQLDRINHGLSFVVFQHWAYKGADAYLLDERRGQWDFERSKAIFVACCAQWEQVTPGLRKVIEAKANGPALVSQLRGKISGLVEWEPEGSKVDRAYACQGYVEGHNVHPPAHAPWLGDWLDEVCGFPNVRWNDRVDVMTQSLLWRYGKGTADRVAQFRKLTGT